MSGPGTAELGSTSASPARRGRRWTVLGIAGVLGIVAVAYQIERTAARGPRDDAARHDTELNVEPRRAAELAAWRAQIERAIPPATDDADADWVDWAAADRELTACFAQQVITPENDQVPSSRVDLDAGLLFFLDEWARVRRARGDDAGAGRIVHTAMQLDPQVRRDALRAALSIPDPDAVERIVRRSSTLEDDAPTLLTAARALRAVGRTLAVVDGDQPHLQLLEAACDRHPENPFLALELGRALRRAGKPWEALRFFQAALALQPDSLPIRREFVALISRGMLDQAGIERTPREALRRHPDDPWCKTCLARALLRSVLRRPIEEAAFFATPSVDATRVAEALALLESAATTSPRADRLATWSSALIALGRNAEAEAVAQRGLDLVADVEPKPRVTARLWQDLGTARFRTGHGDAGSALRRGHDLAPGDARGAVLLADLLAREHREGAATLLDDFLAQHPDAGCGDDVRTRLAELLLYAKKPDEARLLAEGVATRRPRDPIVHRILGRTLRAQGQAKRARDAFEVAYANTVFESERFSDAALEVLSNLVELTGEIDGHPAAIELLKIEIDRSTERAAGRGLAIKSADPRLHVLLGRALHRAQDLIPATEQLQRAIQLGCDDKDVFGEVADLYGERGEPHAALDWAERAASRWPNDVGSQRRLARKLLAAGRAAEAAAAAWRCRELAPDALWPRRLFADALIAAGEHDAAASAIGEAIAVDRLPDRTRDPNDPPFDRWDATYGLGHQLLEKGGRFTAIESFMRLAVDIDPNSADAWCEYAIAIWKQGRPAEALAPMLKRQELGAHRGEDWRNPTARWIEQIEAEIGKR